MPAPEAHTLHFIDVHTPEDVRQAIVANLRRKEHSAVAEARENKGTNEKKTANRLANEFKALADYWEGLLLTDPRRPAAPAPTVVGGKAA